MDLVGNQSTTERNSNLLWVKSLPSQLWLPKHISHVELNCLISGILVGVRFSFFVLGNNMVFIELLLNKRHVSWCDNVVVIWQTYRLFFISSCIEYSLLFYHFLFDWSILLHFSSSVSSILKVRWWFLYSGSINQKMVANSLIRVTCKTVSSDLKYGGQQKEIK